MDDQDDLKVECLRPHSRFVKALMTDMYQVTMAYAYWKSGRHNEIAVFETFFRKNPFGGEFTIFAGLEEVLRYAASFSFSERDIEYLKKVLPTNTSPDFFQWLAKVDCSQVKIQAVPEGTVVFPRIPLIRIEGPLGVVQLLETMVLNLTNFPSLICTNAARMRLAVGPDTRLLEFGLRRAQGPDGALTASRYAFVGGFDGTSNLLAGKLFGMDVAGTHAHAFVSSFKGLEDLQDTSLDGKEFLGAVLEQRKSLKFENSNLSELCAFVSYAQAFPDGFLALVDTYDTLVSGIPNFIAVALTLKAFGHEPVGIRLDSGDLSYLSIEARRALKKHNLEGVKIVASNDINEDVLHSLTKQGHEMDAFGIGTNLVTCQQQPALGMVFKLVQIASRPCIKLSNEYEKTTLPGKKQAYRLIGTDGKALADLMTLDSQQPPLSGEREMCMHPFDERKRCFIRPSGIVKLLEPVFDGKLLIDLPTAIEKRTRVKEQLKLLREDQLRSLNPAAYKVSVTKDLYEFVHNLWRQEAPIREFE